MTDCVAVIDQSVEPFESLIRVRARGLQVIQETETETTKVVAKDRPPGVMCVEPSTLANQQVERLLLTGDGCIDVNLGASSWRSRQ